MRRRYNEGWRGREERKRKEGKGKRGGRKGRGKEGRREIIERREKKIA